MGFVEAIKSFYRRYFDFDGRSSRSEYWFSYLFQFLVNVGLWFVLPVFLMAAGGGFSDPENISTPIMAVSGLFSLAALLFILANIIPGIAITVRRLHDTDKSGWMYLICLIPFGGIVLIVFMCIEGTNGENRFGPDPLGDNMYDTFS